MLRLLKSSFIVVFGGIIALCILIPSLPLQAALKMKKKKSSSTKAVKSKTKRGKASLSKSNPEVGKRQALAFIQSHPELSELAGLDYNPDPNLRQYIVADGEMLTDHTTNQNENELENSDAILADDTQDIDIDRFQKMWVKFTETFDRDNGLEDFTSNGLDKKAVVARLVSWLGTAYHFGGTSRNGIDCSAFTRTMFMESANFALPRTASEQFNVGLQIRTVDELKFGDLVFFNTRRGVYASHVGIYLGGNLFCHSSSKYGVTVSSLEEGFYSLHFIGGRRMNNIDVAFDMPSALPSLRANDAQSVRNTTVKRTYSYTNAE